MQGLTFVVGTSHLGFFIILITILLPRDLPARQTDLYFMGVINLNLVFHDTGFKLRHIYANTMSILVSVCGIVMILALELPSDSSESKEERRKHGIEYVFFLIMAVIVGHYKSQTQEEFRRNLYALKIDLMCVNDAQTKLGAVVRSFISRRRLKKKLKELKERATGSIRIGSIARKDREVGTSTHMNQKQMYEGSSDPVLYSQVLQRRVQINEEGTKRPWRDSNSHQIVDIGADTTEEGP
tara:strand:- start:1750 stop:2469 length:720 start_codon:yes stop_codon:yes gene_type:complete